MKRAFDVLLSLACLIPLVIPMLVIAVAIKREDGGPVLYKQKRIGRGCVPFEMLKFRSMIVNADQTGGFQTMQNDQRVTRIGVFMRAKSIDELPQILNVLKGDMSFVGPRPDVPMQEQLYEPEDWQRRHQVRPGITGLAQVRGRSDIDPKTRLAHDLEYVERANLALDLHILLKTFRVVQKGI
ncbi:sugar transferase [Rhodophyticola sp. CCM32]|uniref:sugar transferase n=1 Tax=Rhodophyticola sp. CCM32 TaxID=2916397 RepID=UPI00107FB376|nr:sugar transferase [Rhodophyticola sp. CCM32]QBY01311.1 sugar transferase [Rhodophyticola sp. CCM32]